MEKNITEMKNYYVESSSRWFVVFTKNKRRARSIGSSEWGNKSITNIREATQDEVDYYVSIKGEQAITDE